MKINKSIIKTLSVCAVAVAMVSCKDEFYDVNENPNNPTGSTPKLTLPIAQQEIAYLHGTSMNYLGNFIMYNWATPSNWSANQEYPRYNITSNFMSGIFERSYGPAFRNFTYVENYTDPNGTIDYSIYKGISTVMKAFQYQYLVDLYGDVPYSEANKRQEITTPKYDKAEDIYKDNINKLTDVVTMLDKIPANAENPGTQDIMFSGKVEMWQKFANTVKLRYLLRLTNTSQDGFIRSEIAKIVANGKGFIMQDVSANPGYSDAAGKLNPFYGYFRKPSTHAQTDRGDYTVATDYTINYLESLNDPRIEYLYAEAEAGGYKGVWQSTALPGKGYTSKDLSKVGPGLIKSPTQDQPIMLLSEALFLQAEAVQRGYLTGNAQALYNSAIKESFRYLGVEDSATEAEAYYSQDLVSYAASSDKIRSIITQKWIALNGVSAEESWIEYNRTGYPAGLPIPEEAGRSTRPYRLLYPASEIARNAANVPKQTKEDVFTKKIFWQK